MKRTPYYLPVQRKHILHNAVFTSFWLLSKLSFVIFIFSIPSILTVHFCRLSELSLIENNDFNSLFMFRWYTSPLFIISILMITIGLCGGYYVIRQYVWGEGVLFWNDFKTGIKKSKKEIICLTIAISFCVVIVRLTYPIILQNYLSTGQFIVIIAAYLVLIFGLGSVIIYTFPQVVIYRTSLFHLFRNSIIFMLLELPKNVGILLLIVIEALILYIDVNVLTLIGLTIMALFGFGFTILIITLFSHSVFDALVNYKHFPEIYRKGLFDGEDEEGDEYSCSL